MPANPLFARNYALMLAARKVRAFLVWEVDGRNAEDSPIRIAMMKPSPIAPGTDEGRFLGRKQILWSPSVNGISIRRSANPRSAGHRGERLNAMCITGECAAPCLGEANHADE